MMAGPRFCLTKKVQNCSLKTTSFSQRKVSDADLPTGDTLENDEETSAFSLCCFSSIVFIFRLSRWQLSGMPVAEGFEAAAGTL